MPCCRALLLNGLAVRHEVRFAGPDIADLKTTGLKRQAALNDKRHKMTSVLK